MAFRDLTGQTFASLTVLRRVPRQGKKTYWECRCICGNLSVVRSDNLTYGFIKSCGCQKLPDDLTGQTFGQLTVIERDARPRGPTHWKCQCACGQTTIVRASQLKNGKTQSCGCLRRRPPWNKRHGMTESDEYRIWTLILRRCHNPKDYGWSYYGGRGIRCLFESFEEFYAEVGPRPSAEHSIDRIDSGTHYMKGNVRWSTRIEQMNNRSNNYFITFEGQTMTVAQWEQHLGVPTGRIYQRIHACGWTDQEALMITYYGPYARQRWYQDHPKPHDL